MRGAAKRVRVGTVPLGGGAPVVVQSMATVDTKNVPALTAQIQALADSGCDIVRVALYDRACAALTARIVEASPVPIVGDVHFDAQIAIDAIESGIHKVRINPGNIGTEADVRRIADAARAHGVPIRVGANSGSLPPAQDDQYTADQAKSLANAAMAQVRLLERAHFEDIVISVKSSNVSACVGAARIMAQTAPYPLHLGVTEAGTRERAAIKSAVGIGALLMDRIGDTIRVSVSGDPLQEAPIAHQILEACGLEQPAVDIISCPTCARCGIDVEAAAHRVEQITAGCRGPLTVAVMGCAVNGPGEARRADFGIAGSPQGAVLFERGEIVRLEKNMDAAYRALEDLIKRYAQNIES